MRWLERQRAVGFAADTLLVGVCAWRQLLGCDEAKMVNWLHDLCELRLQEAKKVTEGLAEKAKKLVAV